MFRHLSQVTFSSSKSGVIVDIPFTHKMSGVSYPKGDRGAGQQYTPRHLSLAGHKSLPRTLGLISVLFVRNSQSHSLARLECLGARFLVRHMGTCPSHRLCFLNPYSRSPPRRQTRWTNRVRLLSMDAGTPMSIMTSSQSVVVDPRPNNKQ
ncbi:hypothetical protein TNCV_5136551 [Trichonephila clavipes]|nr:hypothetical protein TNCV_5136551 [Trichonephila clavipes]